MMKIAVRSFSLVLVLALLGFAVTPLVAQEVAAAAAARIPANKPTAIAFDHDGVNTDGYRLYIDGVKRDEQPATLRQADGSVRFAVPALPAGPHTIEVAAYGLFEEAKAPVFALDAIAAPVPPSNYRIVLTVLANALSGVTGLVVERIESVATAGN